MKTRNEKKSQANKYHFPQLRTNVPVDNIVPTYWTRFVSSFLWGWSFPGPHPLSEVWDLKILTNINDTVRTDIQFSFYSNIQANRHYSYWNIEVVSVIVYVYIYNSV